MIVIFFKKYKWYTKKKYEEFAYITDNIGNAIFIIKRFNRRIEITDIENTYCEYTSIVKSLENMGYIDRGFNFYNKE